MKAALLLLALAPSVRALPQEASDLIVRYLEAFPTTMHPLAAQKAWGRMAKTPCKEGPGGTYSYKPRTCVLEPSHPREVRRITLVMDERGRILEELVFDISSEIFKGSTPQQLMARLPLKRGAVKKEASRNGDIYSVATPFGNYGLIKGSRHDGYQLRRDSGLIFAVEEPSLGFECEPAEQPWGRLDCSPGEQNLTLRLSPPPPPPAMTDAKAWYKRTLELLDGYLAAHPKAPAAWRDIREILAEEKDRPRPHLPTWIPDNTAVGFRYGGFFLRPEMVSEEGEAEIALTWRRPELPSAD